MMINTTWYYECSRLHAADAPHASPEHLIGPLPTTTTTTATTTTAATTAATTTTTTANNNNHNDNGNNDNHVDNHNVNDILYYDMIGSPKHSTGPEPVSMSYNVLLYRWCTCYRCYRCYRCYVCMYVCMYVCVHACLIQATIAMLAGPRAATPPRWASPIFQVANIRRMIIEITAKYTNTANNYYGEVQEYG